MRRASAAALVVVALAGCVSMGVGPFGGRNVWVSYVGEYQSTKIMLEQAAYLVKQPSTKKSTVIMLQKASQRATETLEQAARASDVYDAIDRNIATLQAAGQPVPDVMIQNAKAAEVAMRVWVPRIKADRLYLQTALVSGVTP